MMQFIFGMQINIDIFQKLIPSFWARIVRNAQSNQNKNFTYLPRHQQVGIMVFDGINQTCRKYPK